VLWCANGAAVRRESQVSADPTKLPCLPRLRTLHFCDHALVASAFRLFAETCRDLYPKLRHVTTNEFEIDICQLSQPLPQSQTTLSSTPQSPYVDRELATHWHRTYHGTHRFR
jgi:hypothetical protein